MSLSHYSVDVLLPSPSAAPAAPATPQSLGALAAQLMSAAPDFEVHQSVDFIDMQARDEVERERRALTMELEEKIAQDEAYLAAAAAAAEAAAARALSGEGDDLPGHEAEEEVAYDPLAAFGIGSGAPAPAPVYEEVIPSYDPATYATYEQPEPEQRFADLDAEINAFGGTNNGYDDGYDGYEQGGYEQGGYGGYEQGGYEQTGYEQTGYDDYGAHNTGYDDNYDTYAYGGANYDDYGHDY